MNAVSARAIEDFTNAEIAARYFAAYDALLDKWPIPYESINLTTPLGSTHIIVSGRPDAPPLVLLHGMRTTALVWRSNVEELSKNFRVYAIDVIGQNGRSVSSRRISKRHDYAHWLCAIFNALGIKQAALVGNSYGAFLALSQASLTPERVSGVVLINPAGVFVSVLPLSLQLAKSKVLEALRLRTRDRKKFDLASYMGKAVRLRPDEREWADMVSIIAQTRESRPNMIFPSVFPTRELRTIRVPTLLLMGDNDLLYDPVTAAKTARLRMPSLHVEILKGAHHIAAMAQPAAANREIIHFLESARETATI